MAVKLTREERLDAVDAITFYMGVLHNRDDFKIPGSVVEQQYTRLKAVGAKIMFDLD